MSGKTAVQDPRRLASLESCQDLCRMTPRCEYFAYNTSSSECLTVVGDFEGLIIAEGITTGPRSCEYIGVVDNAEVFDLWLWRYYPNSCWQTALFLNLIWQAVTWKGKLC